MDTIWKVFELIINLSESIIFTLFIIRYFGYKQNIKLKNFSAILLIIILFIAITINNIYVPGYEGFWGLVYIAITFIYALIFLKDSIFERLFIVALEYGILFIVSILIIPAISYIFNADIKEALLMEKSWVRFFTIIIGISIYCFLLKLVIFIKKKNNELKVHQWIFIFLVPFASCLLMVSLFEMKITEKGSLLSFIFNTISIILILILNFIMLYIVSELTKNNKIETEYKLFKQSQIYEEKSMADIQKMYNNAKEIRHNIKHHNEHIVGDLYNIPELTEKQKEYVEKIIKYIDDIGMKISDIDYKVITGNRIIDNILNYKINMARKYNIEVVYYIENSIIKIPDIDINSILGNLLDNAIEACSNINIPEKSIEIKLYKRKVYRCISISNTIEKSILETNQNLISTKKEKNIHGFGIKSIRSIVEKYDGFFTYYEENNRIFFEVFLVEDNLSISHE